MLPTSRLNPGLHRAGFVQPDCTQLFALRRVKSENYEKDRAAPFGLGMNNI
jgi:hypothetical protein